jgi:hypothetical protein
MGEAIGTVHSEAKFLSIWEPVKPDMLCVSKNTMVGQAQDRHSHSKRKKKSEVKRGDISEAKPSEEHLTGFYSSRVIL